MAGAGFKTFVNLTTLPASDVNNYLMEQSLMVFASAAARDAALTSPAEGMHAYLSDVNQVTVYDGTSWRPISTSYTSYSPTLGNITLGTGGTSVFSYSISGTSVNVRGIITLGTGGALTGSPTFTFPFTAVAGQQVLGVARFNDATGSDYPGSVLYASTTTATLRSWNAAGTYAVNTIMSGTVPFTWAVNDVIGVSFTYEAA